MNDPNNQGNAYAYCSGNPIINIDPTGNFVTGIDGIISGLNNISKTLKLLGAFDSKIAKLSSSFDIFVSTFSMASKIKGDFEITFERTVSAQDTGIDGVSYKETIKQTYKKNKLVASETTQIFMSDAGEVTIVTKSGGSDGFSQTYTFEASDKDPNKKVTKTITFKSGEVGDKQINIIATEGFVNTNSQDGTSDPFGALMIATSKQGAIGAWQASSFSNDPASYATISETSDPLIMTKIKHKGIYDAISLNRGGKVPTTEPNPFEGDKTNGEVLEKNKNPNYQTMFATEVEIHCGWTNTWRGSRGCQTLKPGGDDRGTGTSSLWQEFSKTMNLSKLSNGDFIGYYYLIRL